METPNRGAPTPPIPFSVPAADVRRRAGGGRVVPVGDVLLGRLRAVCGDVSDDPAVCAEASRDWWPLAMTWALDGEVPGLATAVARPTSVDEVSAVLAVCNEAGVPVTTAAGRSGVCGASVPWHGGLVLNMCGMAGIVDIERTSLVLDVRSGTFGDVLEDELHAAGLTLGHWPQSIALSTVGGWLACRSAGQYSNRYGKIEHMVVGLDAVLADGRRVTTGGWPRGAVGPDLTQVFVGSEGTLGVITSARLRVHERPAGTYRAAFSFSTFADGLEACRRIVQRHAAPAVLRLYDVTEASRNFQADGNVLLVHDEGDPAVMPAIAQVVGEECARAGGSSLDDEVVDRWFAHRNDVSALEALISRGYVVDTIEVAGRWASLPRMYDEAVAAIAGIAGTLAASAHQSHAYPDGACLYFTFAGDVGSASAEKETYYRAAWDAATNAVLAHPGAALSHHHGVGINRGRFVREALGTGYPVLTAVKAALDPNGILNPAKLGLPDPFGGPAWP